MKEGTFNAIVNEAKEHAKASLEAEHKVVEVNGRVFYAGDEIEKKLPHLPPGLQVSTLGGLIGLLQRPTEEWAPRAVLVESPTSVVVLGSAREDGARQVYALAKCNDPVSTWLHRAENSPQPVQDVIIMLQSLFVRTPTLANLLRQLGNVTSENVMTFADDGVTQAIATKSATKAGAEPIENPIALQPLCTFPEVEPAECRFVVRVQGNKDNAASPISIKLFKVRDGKDDLENKRRIAQLLRDGLPDLAAIIHH